MMIGRHRVMLGALAVLALAACGVEETTTAPTIGGTAATTTTEAPTTTEMAVATTAATTTSIATTTTTVAPATTVEPTTTVAEPAGWSPVAFGELPSIAFPPCCAENWMGEVSPPLAPDGEALADGAYFVTTRWPSDPTTPLQLEVRRFEQCALLQASSCQEAGFEYLPDELGVDASASRTVAVPLDGSVDVVVLGWDGDRAEPLVVERATGTELAALANEVDAAYAAVFAARFLGGEDPDAIVDDVLANPAGGFVPGVGSYRAVTYVPASGPPLLFQAVFPYVDDERVAGRGTDVLTISSVEVVGGRLTLYVYAAYYP